MGAIAGDAGIGFGAASDGTGATFDLPPAAAATIGVPAGQLALPSIQVLDALPAMQSSCAAYGAHCGS